MSWTYVHNVLDERYSQKPPSLSVLPKNSFPPQEFEVREKVANWLLMAFVPFDNLSWIDKLISKKECKKVQDNLVQKDAELKSIWSSSAGESHPHALTQRYVNLSIHTAPIVQSKAEK